MILRLLALELSFFEFSLARRTRKHTSQAPPEAAPNIPPPVPAPKRLLLLPAPTCQRRCVILFQAIIESSKFLRQAAARELRLQSHYQRRIGFLPKRWVDAGNSGSCCVLA